MTSVSSDRRQGVNSSAAVKVPCKAATTAAITLSGEQTIDGVACVTGDRVLVKNQATASTNGIYTVDTGTWTRALDFNGAYDVKNGSLCYVNSGGTANGSGWFIVTCTDPLTIGTGDITFSRQNINNVTRTLNTATAGQTLFNVSNYQPIANSLSVFVNGLRAEVTLDYTETSSTSITFASGLSAGDQVVTYSGLSVGNLTAALASAVSITDAGDFYVGTTVEQVLQEIAGAITADNGNADATLTYASSTQVQRWNTVLTANRTVTLSTSNAKEGARFVIVRGSGATGNYTLAVGSLATLRAPGEWCIVGYDAGTAAWVLLGWGYLPTAGYASLDTNGDASATLTVATSAQTQLWSSALTADRTASLSTTGAWKGAKFRILRDSTATGNYSLIVAKGGTTMVRLAPGEYCDVEFIGTEWIMTAGAARIQTLTTLVQLHDDFLGEEIDGYRWQSLQGTDASIAQPIVYQDQINGVVRMTTGADAGATMALNGVQLQSNLNWRASQGGLVCEIRLAIDAITAVCVFLGLTDQVSALEMPFTLSGTTITSNATDATGVLFDTDATTDDWWLVGVAADVDATKQDAGVAPVAGTFETWRIELSATGVATFYRNGTLIGTAMTGAVTASVGQTPIVAAFARGATSRNIDIDEILLQQQR